MKAIPFYIAAFFIFPPLVFVVLVFHLSYINSKAREKRLNEWNEMLEKRKKEKEDAK